MKPLFKCEKCGTVYNTVYSALACEDTTLGTPKFHVGQKVMFDERYNKNVTDVVEKIQICSDDAYLLQIVDDRENPAEIYDWLNKEPRQLHTYCYYLRNVHQWGKDESSYSHLHYEDGLKSGII